MPEIVSSSTAQVIEEPLELARIVREENNRGIQLIIPEDELSFFVDYLKSRKERK